MKENKTHPSYGLIQFTRINGHNNFFGSDTKPDTYIQLTIKRADVKDEMGKSWYFGRERLLQLRMTNTQFAETITSLNIGSGSPCTLEFFKGEGEGNIEQDTTIEYKIDFHKRAMSENAKNVLFRLNSQIEEAAKTISKLSKKDQESLNSIFSSLKQDLNSNFPWYMEQFYRSMEEVAQDIKANMEADLMHKLKNLGLETLQTVLNDRQLKLK